MKRAKVSELKARLSAYLAAVRRGDTVIVCDRQTPIARITPIEENADDFLVDEPSKSVSTLNSLKRVQLRRKVDIDRLLREDRDHR